MSPFRFVLSLLILTQSLTTVRASAGHSGNEQINPHGSAASGIIPAVLLGIFAFLSFAQIAFIAVPGLFKMQNGDSFTIVGAPESDGLCKYKLSFALLMILSLMAFIAAYSLRAAAVAGVLKSTPAEVMVAEFAKELLFVAMFILLASCVMASEAWKAGSTVTSIRKAKGFKLLPVATILGLMTVLTFVCTIVLAVNPNSTVWSLTWFILHQVHIALVIALAICFVIPVISMWKSHKDDQKYERVDLTDAAGTVFRPIETLRRIAKDISPLLCTAALIELIINIFGSIPVTANSPQFGLAAVILDGLIYFFLSYTTLRAGFTPGGGYTSLFAVFAYMAPFQM